MSLKTEGIPGFWWPAAFSIWALLERLLGGFNIGKFFELANSEHNWMPEILAVSLGGFVLNKAQKSYMEIKKVDSLAAYQSRASSSEDV